MGRPPLKGDIILYAMYIKPYLYKQLKALLMGEQRKMSKLVRSQFNRLYKGQIPDEVLTRNANIPIQSSKNEYTTIRIDRKHVDHMKAEAQRLGISRVRLINNILEHFIELQKEI